MKGACIKSNVAELTATSSVKFGTSGVRGLVAELSPAVCYGFTQAFVQHIRKVHALPDRVVIGHDLRPSSTQITASCSQALLDMQLSVIYVGALPTPAIAYFSGLKQLPAIVVTGSHIPFDRNGIKFYHSEGEISKADEMAITASVVSLPECISSSPLPAPDESALNAYVQRYVDFFGADSLSGLRVLLYEHSSVARDVLRQILTLLGAEIIAVGRVDTFVPIDTEAVRNEDVQQAKNWSQQYVFDAILSTDGDGDRPLIADETGQWFRGDSVGLLCADFLNADTVVTPISSNSAVEYCDKFKKVIRTRIGSPYVIDAMQLEIAAIKNSVVGYEANGGFLLGSDIVRNGKMLTALPTRDAVLPMLALLMMAKESGCKLSELSRSLPARYTASNRLQNFSPAKSEELLQALQLDAIKAAQILAPDSGSIVSVNTLDGFRATFANGDIVHLRASGNTPELRCYAESSSSVAAQSLSNAALQRIDLDD